MSILDTTTVVIVPGLRGHVAEHWQTLLAARLPKVTTVEPLQRDKFGLAARVAALDEVVAGTTGPVLLVAHSAGVMITVAWAQRHDHPVVGALLATPPDLTVALPAGYPTPEQLRDNGWYPTPRTPLRFPSIVAASSNDPLCGFDRAAALARHWDSRLVDAGPVGHLNPAAGYGHWPAAEDLVRELAEAPPPRPVPVRA
ncbi:MULTISPECIES: RBBP9/YdeN family alpha/beta hydrolase [unclassified Rhodococcus (in: high G+C Gram-positive bacteria)]|uniref:RBBP9/YdeN family alpha/beta hydrolase n=1 Tax=unclassified Rhodococcus (in: high G+C Gram-positive bacteria) TaxID=192944 RepID=UPI0009278A82|nr:alpha/beta fold hydrolase [Rhodococcus sp. M8]OLL18885.1 alpha/beta hydrolase [Rhodococcus sp. M8]QPG47575.1 alpha/beta hydrolase [Rhodococcus sp. M8]